MLKMRLKTPEELKREGWIVYPYANGTFEACPPSALSFTPSVNISMSEAILKNGIPDNLGKLLRKTGRTQMYGYNFGVAAFTWDEEQISFKATNDDGTPMTRDQRLDRAEDEARAQIQNSLSMAKKLAETELMLATANQDRDYWHKKNDAMSERLRAIDTMGSDLNKVQDAIGKIKFKEIVGYNR